MTPSFPMVVAVLPAVVVGLLLPLAIVGLVAYGVVELVRAGDSRPDDGPGERVEPGTSSSSADRSVATPAVAILDERFARGEIDTEDYVERRELLLASVGRAAPAHVDEATADAVPTATADTVPTATADPATPTDEDAPGASPDDEATGEQPSA